MSATRACLPACLPLAPVVVVACEIRQGFDFAFRPPSSWCVAWWLQFHLLLLRVVLLCRKVGPIVLDPAVGAEVDKLVAAKDVAVFEGLVRRDIPGEAVRVRVEVGPEKVRQRATRCAVSANMVLPASLTAVGREVCVCRCVRCFAVWCGYRYGCGRGHGGSKSGPERKTALRAATSWFVAPGRTGMVASFFSSCCLSYSTEVFNAVFVLTRLSVDEYTPARR